MCCWTALLPTSPVPSVKRSGRFFDRETSSCWKATSVPGKTTFTQGLARGMGIGDAVTSPTFVLARELGREEGLVPLTHVDAYRLTSLGEWDDLDVDIENSVVVIEWGERIEDALPLDRVHVRLTETDDARAVRIWAPDGSQRRLFDAIRAAVT